MKKTSPEYRGAQANALKSFTSLIGDLTKIFDPKEISQIVNDFIASIQYSPSAKLLNMEKLQMIQKLIVGSLFTTLGMFFL